MLDLLQAAMHICVFFRAKEHLVAGLIEQVYFFDFFCIKT